MDIVKKLSEKNYRYTILDWDTDFFGVDSAKIVLEGPITPLEVAEINEICTNHDFITIQNLNNLSVNNFNLRVIPNVFLADTNMQLFRTTIERGDSKSSDSSTQNYYAKNERILEISRESFIYSRFFNDPNLPSDKAQNIYQHWVQCAFNRSDKYFVTTEREGRIAGFILFFIAPDLTHAVIELIAVDSNYRGMQVGSSLINELDRFLISEKIGEIRVGTQSENTIALNFYTRQGFLFKCANSVFHVWNKDMI